MDHFPKANNMLAPTKKKSRIKVLTSPNSTTGQSLLPISRPTEPTELTTNNTWSYTPTRHSISETFASSKPLFTSPCRPLTRRPLARRPLADITNTLYSFPAPLFPPQSLPAARPPPPTTSHFPSDGPRFPIHMRLAYFHPTATTTPASAPKVEDFNVRLQRQRKSRSVTWGGDSKSKRSREKLGSLASKFGFESPVGRTSRRLCREGEGERACAPQTGKPQPPHRSPRHSVDRPLPDPTAPRVSYEKEKVTRRNPKASSAHGNTQGTREGEGIKEDQGSIHYPHHPNSAQPSQQNPIPDTPQTQMGGSPHHPTTTSQTLPTDPYTDPRPGKKGNRKGKVLEKNSLQRL